MNKLVKELDDARVAVTEAVSKIAKDKREAVLLGDWSLKDIVAHLSGWAKYQLEVIDAIAGSRVLPEPGNIDKFNKQSTEARTKLSWDKVYTEFLEVSQKLVNEYKKVKDDQWTKSLWKNKKTTLEKFINIEVRHYKNTHLPQILKLLKG
jgi:hypothetical protein